MSFSDDFAIPSSSMNSLHFLVSKRIQFSENHTAMISGENLENTWYRGSIFLSRSGVIFFTYYSSEFTCQRKMILNLWIFFRPSIWVHLHITNEHFLSNHNQFLNLNFLWYLCQNNASHKSQFLEFHLKTFQHNLCQSNHYVHVFPSFSYRNTDLSLNFNLLLMIR